MSVGNCNELQASMILAIMANRSVNHEGFEFYARYLMGNDSEAQYQFKSIRYHDYYVFWEGFLKEWSKKSIEEKADALQIDTPSDEKTNEILENMDAEEAGLVIDRLTPVLDNFNETIEELQNYKGIDLPKGTRLKNKMNSFTPSINNAVEKAHIEYSIVDHPAPLYDAVFNYKTDALDIYNNPNLTNYEKVEGLNNLKDSYTHNFNKLKDNVESLNTTGDKIHGKGENVAVLSALLIPIGGGFLYCAIAALEAPTIVISVVLFILAGLCFTGAAIVLGIGCSMKTNGSKVQDIADKLNKYKILNEEAYKLSVVYIDQLVASLY